MKFFHTADWQIGMKADFVGKAAQIVRDERLAAGKRLVDAANNESAEFILIAGDLFEDNAVERTLIQRIVDVLTRFHGPVYLIPGNHDPLVPGSVWDHPAWRSAQNLFVLTEAKPVEETATRLLQRIAGRRIGQIAIGENFGPSGVQPELVDAPVELFNLSGGEQEQLYLATRLALAEVLAKNERQMVVLDDVLTATDTGRLVRIMTILEESAQHLQILILTCHPERYRALAGAEFFDLESLLKI